ncbi:hypothetical protein J2Z59_001583 [Jeotgalicoccus pinnipedialis]|nr:hypothetical protein [Jeotgalicoccus pinnipedialis]
MQLKNMVIYFIIGGTSALIFSFMSNTVYKLILIAILLIIAILIDKKNKSKN